MNAQTQNNGRAGLLAAVLAGMWLVTAFGCSTPPAPTGEVSEAQIQALMERQRQAEGLFQEALASEGDAGQQEALYRRAIDLSPGHGRA